MEHAIADIVNSWYINGNDAAFRSRMDAFSNKTLLAYGIAYIMNAGIGKSAGRAFKGFMAIGKA
jgi:hypothetical protein